MALVPDLTRDDGSRVLLNSARHAMTIMSNCAVFIAMWAMLRVAGAGGALTPNACAPGFDLAPIYQALSLFVVTVGGVCTAVFLAGTPERPALPLLDGAATVATIGMQQRRNLAAAAAPAAGGVNRPTGDGNDAGADAGALSTGIEMRTVQVKSLLGSVARLSRRDFRRRRRRRRSHGSRPCGARGPRLCGGRSQRARSRRSA